MKEPLGGIIALSGAQGLKHEATYENNISVLKQTPMFIYHGVGDITIPIHDAINSYEYIIKNIYTDGSDSKMEAR